MTPTPRNLNQDFRPILSQTIRIYQQAQIDRLQAERSLAAAAQQAAQQTQSQQQAQTRQAAQEDQTTRAPFLAEQARLTELIRLIEAIAQAARVVVEKIGPDYVQGVALPPPSAPQPPPGASFGAAQLAWIDLQLAQLRLAAVYLQAGQFERARSLAGGLINDPTPSISAEARRLVGECLALPARAALERGDWESARSGFEALLAHDPAYPAAQERLRESWLMPAQQALTAAEWETARRLAQSWLKKHKDDETAAKIARQSYLQPAQQAAQSAQWQTVFDLAEAGLKTLPQDKALSELKCRALYELGVLAANAGQWEEARRHLAQVQSQFPGYRDSAERYRQAHLQPARLAVQKLQGDEARTLLTAWLKIMPNDAEAQQMLSDLSLLNVRQLMREYRWGDARRGLDAFLRQHHADLTALALIDEVKRLKQADVQRVAEARRQPNLIMQLPLGIQLAFRPIPAGEFICGEPQTIEYLPDYWIGVYPVTVAQFASFVRATAYEGIPGNLLRDVQNYGQHPVTNVSQKDALAFCEYASRATGKTIRLPTIGEWEKAARGVDGHSYPWGEQPPDIRLCNFDGQVSPVGRYSPQGDSPYGCMDMAGNVWEWTLSIYPRGGSFGSFAESVRCAFHYVNGPDGSLDHLGFRLCVSPI